MSDYICEHGMFERDGPCPLCAKKARDDRELLHSTAHGDECPLCHNGTVEHAEGEVRCRGECGAAVELARLSCPECGSYSLFVRVGLVFEFDGLDFGEQRRDGPEENVEPTSTVVCQTCEWTGEFQQLTGRVQRDGEEGMSKKQFVVVHYETRRYETVVKAKDESEARSIVTGLDVDEADLDNEFYEWEIAEVRELPTVIDATTRGDS